MRTADESCALRFQWFNACRVADLTGGFGVFLKELNPNQCLLFRGFQCQLFECSFWITLEFNWPIEFIDLLTANRKNQPSQNYWQNSPKNTNGNRKLLPLNRWMREPDSNRRPPGYEPGELPDCSISQTVSIRLWSFCQPDRHQIYIF